MAAALVHFYADDKIEVRSAGSAPADILNSVAIEAMAELGIDLVANGATPKVLEPQVVVDSDVIITMGCGDTCPIFPGKRYEDWELDDPAGQGIEAVRRIREQIDVRVRALIVEILGEMPLRR
jgi:arsenate reductase